MNGSMLVRREFRQGGVTPMSKADARRKAKRHEQRVVAAFVVADGRVALMDARKGGQR